MAILQAETVLAATAEGFVRLFSRGDGGSSGSAGSDSTGSAGNRENEQLLLVSKQTWAAYVAEAGRRRLRVGQILGGGRACTGDGGGGPVALGSGGLETVATMGTGAEQEEGDDEM